MFKKTVKTDKAPKAIGSYSQAVVYNNIVYCSGQIGLVPKSMTLVDIGVEKQTIQVMQNLEQVLLSAGSSFGNVLKCSIFLTNMDDFSAVNEIYARYFKENPPTRETVEVSNLPKDAKVEISCIAFIS